MPVVISAESTAANSLSSYLVLTLRCQRSYTYRNRKRKTNRSSRSHRFLLSTSGLNAAIRLRCCGQCNFHTLSKSNIQRIRTEYLSSSFAERQEISRRQINNSLLRQASDTSSRSLSDMVFHVQATSMCRLAWRTLYGFSESKTSRLIRRVRAGELFPSTAHSHSRATPGRDIAIVWLKDTAKTLADKMPHVDRMHLPSCFYKSDIYNMYVESLTDQDDSTPVSLVCACKFL